MAALTAQQVDERYEALPEQLKDALFSVYNAEEIDRIGKSQFLSDEKIAALARITGRVIMGFIHEDDFVKLVRDEVGIPGETAGLVSREIDRKILHPLKEDIRKIYAPVGEEAAPALPKPGEGGPAPAIEPKEEKTPVPPQAPPGGPVSLEALHVAPAPAAPSRPSEQAKIHPFALGRPAVQPVEEKKPAPAPAEPKPAGEEAAPAPFMIHKEEAQKPIMESKPVQIRREAAVRPEAKKPTAVRLELSGPEEEKKKKEAVVGKTEVPRERIVHYSAFRTPVNPFGGPPAPAPAPSAPPAPAPKPVPPAPAPPTPPPAAKPMPAAKPAPALKPALPPKPAPAEEVIDLSTFERQSSPKLDGNTVDLRG